MRVYQFHQGGKCDSGEARTRDPYIKSVLLYQLSYRILKAVRTGLEPATPCVTGMYSNQLNYRTKFAVRTGFEPATFATFITSRIQMVMDRGVFQDVIVHFDITQYLTNVFFCLLMDYKRQTSSILILLINPSYA
jgi:hypothetical protein